MGTGKIVTLTIIFGVGLIVALIIGGTIIQNLATVQDDLGSNTRRIFVVNESGVLSPTGTRLAGTNTTGWNTIAITSVYNATATGGLVGSGNYTLNSVTGIVTNSSTSLIGWASVYISYNYYVEETTASISNARENFSEGIKTVSNKIPTIALVAVIVIILAMLLILWGYYRSMNFGSSSGVRSTGGSGKLTGEL